MVNISRDTSCEAKSFCFFAPPEYQEYRASSIIKNKRFFRIQNLKKRMRKGSQEVCVSLIFDKRHYKLFSFSLHRVGLKEARKIKQEYFNKLFVSYAFCVP